ncbi:hypothetical protein CEXT_664521 [Caerostris extrusa]|uniref:Uncharacterized protein n=1 Tax=Caerostris extrusa TaxID=172846 RepID=A0AAV4WR15_CAEEX|nr:hypothetical protein CEXT_664521 [Caerostris extrusa]
MTTDFKQVRGVDASSRVTRRVHEDHENRAIDQNSHLFRFVLVARTGPYDIPQRQRLLRLCTLLAIARHSEKRAGSIPAAGYAII